MPRPDLPGYRPTGGKPYSKHCKVWNYSGSSIADQSVVVLDPANTLANLRLAVKVQDYVGYTGVKGVIEGGAIADSASGFMVYRGIADCLVSDDNGDVAAGDTLVSSNYSSGGYAQKADGSPAAGTVLGIALEAETSDATCKVYVDPR